MQYFILPVVLFVVSELIGSVILNKLNIKNQAFKSLAGFSFILACLYVLYFPLVIIDVNIIVLVLVTAIFFIALLLYIIKNRRLIKITFNIKDVLLFVLLIAVQIYFASRNTVGSLWRYDTITYTNMITGSIYGETINSLDWANGFETGFMTGYSFQSFYKLASVLYYCINVFCNVLRIEFFYFTQHVWMYTLLLYTFMAEITVDLINEFKIKNLGTKALIILFFIFFMGNFYWNSEQAYLGNAFRMVMTSGCLYYLYYYLKEKENRYLALLIVFNYANSACAACNTSLAVILVFFLWAVDENRRNALKYYAVSLYLPLINLLVYAFGFKCWMVATITAVAVIVFSFENIINKLTDKLKLKVITPIVVAVLLIFLSYRITGNLFDFASFLDNMSGWSDMTWDYTDFSSLWRTIANICYFILMIIALVRYRSSKMTKMLILVTVVFFNPFAAAVQEKFMPVFYRNYDIVINYFTLMCGFKVIDEYENRVVRYSITVILLLSFSYIGYNQLNYHPGSDQGIDNGFEKGEDYSGVLKMDNDTADALLFMKDYLVSNGIDEGKVISSIYQFRTEFPYMKTLYNRSKVYNGIEKDMELYKIFYPDDYYGDENGYPDADYEHIFDLLEESDYMFVILGEDKIYHDEKEDSYYPLRYLLSSYYTPLYENDTYSIYRIH